MTSKNLFFKLMKEDLKRRLWAVALIALGCFFVFPVMAAFMAGSIEEAVTYERGMAIYTRDLLNTVSFDNGLTAFGMTIAALICGLSSFSYLNSRSKVDFYHGIPVRREKLFAANFLNGILILAAPYGICLALATIIGISNGVSGSVLWSVVGTAYLLHVIYYILMYATVVVAAMMTGNLIVGFLGSMVFAFVVPLTATLIQGYFVVFYKTFLTMDVYPLYRLGVRLSPLLEYIYEIKQYGQGESIWIAAGGAVLVSAVLAFLGCFLYRKRPSEAAGKAMAFAVSRPIINVILTMVSAIGMGLFFWEMRESMGWAVFGILCGAVICHCVVEIIYHFDFKKLFANKLQLAGCILASLAILCIFRYDLTGYDTWVPQAGKVKSAAIEVSLLDNWVSYGSAHEDKNGTWIWDSQNSSDAILKNMRCQDVENIFQIAEGGIRQMEKEDSEDETVVLTDYMGDEAASVSVIGGADGPTSIFLAGKLGDGSEEDTDEEEIRNWSEIRICYTMNSGRKVYRRYGVYLEDILPQMERLMADQQFLQGTFPLMNRAADQVEMIRYREGTLEKALDDLTPEQKKELLVTYQKEFAALTIPQMYEQAPVGLIRFTSGDEEKALAWLKRQEELQNKDELYYIYRAQSWGGSSYRYHGYYGNEKNRDYYPVYPSFTKTLALLETYGVEAGSYYKEQNIESVRVRDYHVDQEEWHGSWREVTFTDQREIKALMEVLVDQSRMYYNPLYQSEELNVTLAFTEGGETSERDALFPKGEIPSFVKTRLEDMD